MIYPDTNSYYCFGCKKGGDIFDFVMDKEHCSFPEAISRIEGIFGIKANSGVEILAQSKIHLVENILLASAVYFQEQLSNTDTAIAYLIKRGVNAESISKFMLGYAPVDYDLLGYLEGQGFEIEDIFLSGLIKKGTDGNQYSFFRDRIIFPYLKNGRVAYMAGRELPGASSNAKYLKLKVNEYVQNEFYNSDALFHRNGQLIITEGYFDCILAVQNGFSAVSAGGTQIREDLLKGLEGRTSPCQIAFDNEKSGAGEEAAVSLADRLFRTGVAARIISLPRKESVDKVDLADFLSAHTVEEFISVLDIGAGLVDYQIQKISSLPEEEKYQHIKGDLIPLLSRLEDLDVERYLNHLKELLGFNSKIIEAIRKELRNSKASLELQGATQIEKPRDMTEEERQEALSFLKDPEIFARLAEDFQLLGIVGEEKNAVCLYLISISRKFDEPISAVVSAKSSSGKSHLANTISKLTPPEDRLIITSASARSLDYIPEEQLQNKLLLVQEVEGMSEIMETIKLMQSEGRISRLTTFENPRTGKRELQALNKNVSVSVITTTTRDRIQPENASRIFEIHVNESQDQTRVINELNKLKATREWELHKRHEIEPIKQRHHNSQRLLNRITVVIPYSEKIEFPSSAVRYRRDSARFLNLIKAVAFLRQYQKEEKSDDGLKYIEADIEDYEISYRIGRDILRNTLSEFSDKEILIIKLALQIIDDKVSHATSDINFTRKDIRLRAQQQRIELPSEPIFISVLKSLTAKDIFSIQEGSSGKKYLYQLTITSIEEAEARLSKDIMSPEELRRRIEKG